MLRALLAAALALLAVAEADVVVYKEELPQLVTIEDEFHDLPASFGPLLPFDGLRGLLMVGEPENGCWPMTAPPVANYTEKWIVLVARLDCSFEMKVRHAMAAGFDCVIVHNVNSSDLETMSAKNPDGINISSVFVGSEAGDRLKTYTYKDGPYHIMVNGDLPFNFNTHLLLPFAVIVALCLIVIIIFMIVKCIKDRRRARRHRLPNRSLRKIPTCKFSKGDPYDTCAICLDDYQEGERLRVLPCAHAYHAKCIDPWLTQNRRVCPVCKRRVLAAGERDRRTRSDSDSDDSDSPLLDSQPQPTQYVSDERDRRTRSDSDSDDSDSPLLDSQPQPTQYVSDERDRRTRSDSDSDDSDSPLLDSQPQPTQGGTFEPQRENPFARALRLSRALAGRGRAAPTDDLERLMPDEENQEVAVETEDPPPPPAPAPPPPAAGGRRARRARGPRSRARSAGGARPAPAPAPDTHSINTETRGEIGVAALPAPSTSPTADSQPTVEYR